MVLRYRQIHPVLEKGSSAGSEGNNGPLGKFGQLPPLPPNARKSLSGIDEGKILLMSSSLPSGRGSPPLLPNHPPSSTGGFIHVNSGRIELVSNRFNNNGGGGGTTMKDQQQQQQQSHHEGTPSSTSNKLVWRNGTRLIKGGNGSGSNSDTARHSWCGSVFRVRKL
jgi:hypothetical protein